MSSRHIVPVDVEGAENWPTLRTSDLVLLFDFFAVLLLPVGVLGQLSELVGKLMSVDLLNRIQQDDWRLLNLLQNVCLLLISLVDHVAE